MKLRHLAEKFIRCSMGNGQSAKFWFDSWTPLGPLIKLLGQEGPRNLRVPLNAFVADAADDVGWKLAGPRSEAALALHVHLTTIHLPNTSVLADKYSWYVDDSKINDFSSKLTWNEIRRRDSFKSWYNLIWFKGSTMNMSFMM